ncbi:MAG: GTPase HflX [Planctomycetaceae bacterium]|jgi:GTP-binding protein HflX|nr:GTPase HflX [Planctomycetaceae bacterium]
MAQFLARMDSTGESAILAGVYLDGQGTTDEPLDELAGLAEAAGVTVCGRIIQRRRKPEGATYIGSGKLEELKELAEANDANLVIFDNDLAPGQTKNLETALNIKVLDRTELILDIFASRARTSEARLAVELAQLEYSLPRLKRMWTHLERQGVGGVGLRGPGEKQLEVDRRLAQKRILDLKAELQTVYLRRQREVKSRKTSRTVSLIGYTNAGKSTLLNKLTDSDVFVKDQLFATLDTRTRRWSLPGWGPVLLSDTVGFIRDLPHHLVAGFRATLEEVNQADLLLHVADASCKEVNEQISAVYNVLTELGINEKDTVLVLNKTDALSAKETADGGQGTEEGASVSVLSVLLEKYPSAIPVSAATGFGFERLTAAVSEALSKEFCGITVTMPIGNGRLAALLAREGEILSSRYDETSATVRCRLPKHLLGILQREKDITIDGLPQEPPPAW